jgi:hypothetical protein
MGTSDPPRSVRIRTDEGNEYRFDAIESASEFYDVNRSDAVTYACDDVVRLADAIEDILQLVDSVQERREIADRLDRAASFDINIDHEIAVGEGK